MHGLEMAGAIVWMIGAIAYVVWDYVR